ncbi:DUF397 domain-containing protein [Thermobifida cellulosilytica]|uniref:DUF397 domain-containing protein n=1 Tax=Thermobifida cellulosilytica TB100 TaxID=665004 RepID=A0A147KN22_THECS|nr:DUF397 domain-containing protein [Thermobifida cellulosilytica]KUP98669.1 hypothetical protein AC529_00025 [Thermobifida cellulosilytica TB100]
MPLKSDSRPLRFRKSSYSGARTENCVEVADIPGKPAAAVRDSQNPHLGHLVIPGREWAAFLDAVRTNAL